MIRPTSYNSELRSNQRQKGDKKRGGTGWLMSVWTLYNDRRMAKGSWEKGEKKIVCGRAAGLSKVRFRECKRHRHGDRNYRCGGREDASVRDIWKGLNTWWIRDALIVSLSERVVGRESTQIPLCFPSQFTNYLVICNEVTSASSDFSESIISR